MATRNFTMKDNNGAGWDILYPKTNMNQVEGLDAKIGEVEAIAKGASRGHVFDTVSALDTWLAIAANKATLQIGDNFYIKAKDVPDYWWDGTAKQELETQKVTLNNATSSADGLMAKGDKSKLDGIATGATKVTSPSDIGAAATAHTHTKANVGLGNVDNTADSAKNVASAAKLTNTRKINGVDFDGTSDITITADPAAHTHVKSQITDFPASMPASDVSAWAKAASKPTYTASEVGAVPTTRKVNNKALSADITLAASDVGAATAAQGAKADTALQSIPFETTNGNIKAPGAATAGSSGKVADAAHVHPLQTTVSGNAGTATKLSAAKTFSLTGAVNGSVSSDLSGAVSIATTLATPVITVGAIAPANPKVGDVWFDTNNN